MNSSSASYYLLKFPLLNTAQAIEKRPLNALALIFLNPRILIWEIIRIL